MCKRLVLSGVMVLLYISLVNAESTVNVYPATDTITPDISTGQNQDWFYIKVGNPGAYQYIGIDKQSRGELGIADNNEFIGRIWLLPAFKHPVNSEWYVCPVRDIETVHQASNLGNGWFFDTSDSSLPCYQYFNPTVSANANIDIQILLKANNDGSTKININTTVIGVSPSDTGFGFLFFPETPAKYRYVRLNGQIYDLAGVEGQLPSDKVFEFLSSTQDPIGHVFDWSDMLDTGNRYSEILTIGGQKGFLVGTYGYGASNRIEIDPIYNFTSSAVSPSWHLINGSLVDYVNENEYAAKVNITTGISDGNESTAYETLIGTNDIYNFYYSFNDVGQSYAHDSSGNDNDLTLMPYAEIDYCPSGGDLYALHCLEENGGGAKALSQDEFQIQATDFTIGMNFHLHNTTAFSKYVLRKYEYPVGYYIYVDSTNHVRLFMRDSNGTTVNIASTTTVYDDSYHSLIIRRNVTNGSVQLILDGVVEATGSGLTGDLVNYDTLSVGTISESSGFDGHIDELFLSNTYWSDARVQAYNETRIVYNASEGKSVQVYFNNPINISNSYSLKIYKTTSNILPIRIYSMLNMTDINESSYYDTVVSEGLNYVDIDSIIYDGYNYPFRFGGLHNGDEIYDVYLVEVGNDTSPPVIYGCGVNDSFVDCNESVTWYCHVTDDTDVIQTFGRVRVVGTNHTITQEAFRNPEDSTLWEVKLTGGQITFLFESLNWTFDSYLNISLDYVNATDLSGNTAENSSFSAWNIYGCILCTPVWTAQYGVCQANNTKFKYYTDNQSCNNTFGLPGDNATWVVCDYCTPDVEKSYTSECTWNGTYYIIDYEWVDNNYFSCCAIVVNKTIDDCPTDYAPYNETGTEYCTFLANDFDVVYDEDVYFGLAGDKVYWKFDMNNTNASYKCQSYVTTTSGNLLQMNPVYTKKTNTLIQFTDSEIEDRTYFEVENGIGQAYFTKENLVIDGRLYLFGVECANEEEVLRSERLVHVYYEPLNAPINRFVWLKENVWVIPLFILLLVIIGILLSYIVRKFRGL